MSYSFSIYRFLYFVLLVNSPKFFSLSFIIFLSVSANEQCGGNTLSSSVRSNMCLLVARPPAVGILVFYPWTAFLRARAAWDIHGFLLCPMTAVDSPQSAKQAPVPQRSLNKTSGSSTCFSFMNIQTQVTMCRSITDVDTIKDPRSQMRHHRLLHPTHRKKSSIGIQKIPSFSSFSPRSTFFKKGCLSHSFELSDPAPVHSPCPQGFRNFTKNFRWTTKCSTWSKE